MCYNGWRIGDVADLEAISFILPLMFVRFNNTVFFVTLGGQPFGFRRPSLVFNFLNLLPTSVILKTSVSIFKSKKNQFDWRFLKVFFRCSISWEVDI